ncbi:TetR/AcrR family transcriptional regulator [Paenibacillus sp. GYB003]|uniref:TetR/AcrR family transcriptional regulator n=1 Tax=Paenibacillus sp. GYB003 TaxID=2994392 RepID=UPI002F963E9C
MSETERKTDRRISKSKRALKRALLDLLAEKEFKAVTITEIVDRADCNRGTFYAHYEQKEALLADVIREAADGLAEAFREPYRDKDVFSVHELPHTAVVLFDHMYRNASLFRTLQNGKVWPDFRDRVIESFKTIVLEDLDVSSGHQAQADPELQAVYQIHALLGLTFHWVEQGFRHTPDYMAKQLLLIVNLRPDKIYIKRGSKPRTDRAGDRRENR